MAVPAFGRLHLSKIANEKHFDNYNHTQLPTAPYSLKDISTSGNSGGSGVSYDSTNQNSTHKPDGNTPHRMGEFYGYNHTSVSLSSQPITPTTYPKNVFACGVTTSSLGWFNSNLLAVGVVGYTSNTGSTYLSAGHYGVGSSQTGISFSRFTVGANGVLTDFATCTE